MSQFHLHGSAKSIAQIHNGIRYRSRTEARWAEYFRLCEIDFQYEPEGYDLGDGDFYVPDFYLPYSGVFFEVKHGRPNPREMRVAAALSLATQSPVVVAQGNPWRRVVITGLKPGLGWSHVSLMTMLGHPGSWLNFPHSSIRLSPRSWGKPDCVDHRLDEAGRLQFQGTQSRTAYAFHDWRSVERFRRNKTV